MHRSARLVFLTTPAACLCLCACSTIVTGTGQQIAVSTPDASNATCRLTGGDGVDATVSTPASVRVPKSKKDIEIACSAPGRTAASQTVKSAYSDWSVVEYPLGYPIDAATGAMWVYPKQVAVSFGDAAAGDAKMEAGR